ncbi:rho guanine nucleotide exchange factor 18-like [Hyperolius riggenbachi]|uniref:rho guanine nucleotide exchange factor 18-like n=1 Tax=Hyperolius riggenbachi TaxID=752182 RepID=UPI0035A31504
MGCLAGVTAEDEQCLLLLLAISRVPGECTSASEGKPCSEFTTVPDSKCMTPDGDPRIPSLEPRDPLFMVEEKDDQSDDLDDHYCSDMVSSSEDLLSLDSSLQGTEYYNDLELTENKIVDQETTKVTIPRLCVASGTNISFDNGEVVITYTKPLLCPMPLNVGTPLESQIHKEKGSKDDVTRPKETIPILVRSLSTSRRHSWDDAVSPTDTACRFRIDALGMDSDEEKELKPQEIQPIAEPWVTKASLKMEADAGKLVLMATETVHKEEESSAKRLRSKSVPSTLDKITTPRVSRSLESSCPVIEVIQPPQLEMIEKDHVEPTHVLFVQQVLQELKQYHGTEGTGRSPEKVERGTKVKRRLSSLKNRVTGSWQKDKGKTKDQLQGMSRELQDKWMHANRHELILGCFSSHLKYTLCTKALINGCGLQCMFEQALFV